MAHVTAAFDQDSFRFRADDGSESTANWLQNANINITVGPSGDVARDANFRVRFLIQETAGGGDNNHQPQLQYNRNTLGWNDVNGTSSVVRSSASPNFTEGVDTVQRIGAGTFITPNSGMDETNGLAGEANDIDFAGNDEVEVEYCVQVRSADTANGDSIQLRVVGATVGVYGSYTNTPDMSVSLPTQVNLSGAQPAATGTIAAKQTLFRSLAGNQPNATGSISTGGVTVAGNQPAATGALTQKYLIALAGSQPAGSGALTQKYLILVAGNQPNATGGISLMRAFIALAGNQPASVGSASASTFNTVRDDIILGLNSDGVEVNGWNAEVRDKEVVTAVVRTSDTLVTITLSAAAAYAITTGETITVTIPAVSNVAGVQIVGQPTFTIELSGVTQVTVTGNQPAASGSLTQKYLIALAGNQPASTGTISAFQTLSRSLAGSQPASTGTLAVKYLIAVAGAQPAATGEISVKYLIAVSGSQPAASGTLAVLYRIALAGDQPNATGTISSGGVSIAGDQPASTGTLTQRYLIALAGDQPAPSGSLTAVLSAFVALAGDQPNATGVLTQKYLIALAGDQPAGSSTLTFVASVTLSGNQPAATGALSLHAFIALAGAQPASTGALIVFFIPRPGSATGTVFLVYQAPITHIAALGGAKTRLADVYPEPDTVVAALGEANEAIELLGDARTLISSTAE